MSSEYDPETNTFATQVTEVPTKKEEPYYCPRHLQVAWEWHTNGRGKEVMGCPTCSGVHHASRTVQTHIVRYVDPLYWRERPLTEKEKQYKPLRGS